MKTAHIQIRVSPELKELVKAEAQKRNIHVSELIIKALKVYGEKKDV